MIMEDVVRALDEYYEARKDLEKPHSPTAECGDWDCGFSREFDESYAMSFKRQRVEDAKKALTTALDSYIDARVEATLQSAIDRQGPKG